MHIGKIGCMCTGRHVEIEFLEHIDMHLRILGYAYGMILDFEQSIDI